MQKITLGIQLFVFFLKDDYVHYSVYERSYVFHEEKHWTQKFL